MKQRGTAAKGPECLKTLSDISSGFQIEESPKSGYIEGEDRHQATLFPERLDDYIAEDISVRVIDVLIDDLDLSGLGFKVVPSATGRPAYHTSTLLKLYVYAYLKRIQ